MFTIKLSTMGFLFFILFIVAGLDTLVFYSSFSLGVKIALFLLITIGGLGIIFIRVAGREYEKVDNPKDVYPPLEDHEDFYHK